MTTVACIEANQSSSIGNADLEETRKLVARLGGCIEDLVEHGFEKFTPDSLSSFSGKQFYVDKTRGVMVKRPYVSSHKTPPPHPVETLMVYAPQTHEDKNAMRLPCYEDNYDTIYIQPIVDVRSSQQYEAHTKLRAYGCGEDDENWFDFRKDNCGMHNGVPVIIDW